MKLYTHNKGYIETVVNGKRSLLHRVIYEEYHNVILTNKDVIHHIDGNKENNDVSNLELTNNSEHAKLHQKSRIKPLIQLICQQCNKKYKIPIAQYKSKIKQGQTIFVCSKHCGGLMSSKKATQFKSNPKYLQNVQEGLKLGLFGPEISRKYNMNRKTVYNIIKNQSSPVV